MKVFEKLRIPFPSGKLINLLYNSASGREVLHISETFWRGSSNLIKALSPDFIDRIKELLKQHQEPI